MFDKEDISELFDKKKSREELKLEKIKVKQQKLELENQKKNKMFHDNDSIKFTKVEDIPSSSYSKEKKKRISHLKEEETKKTSAIGFLYDTLFGFITILLFLTSLGYLGYSFYKNEAKEQLLISILLVTVGFFYMLSMFTKNQNLKKGYAIITSLALMGFMAVKLFQL